jgi:hypothetical protein
MERDTCVQQPVDLLDLELKAANIKQSVASAGRGTPSVRVSDRAMGPALIVVPFPPKQFAAGIFDREEQLVLEALVSEPRLRRWFSSSSCFARRSSAMPIPAFHE